jgi:hypothetical protein
MDQRSAHRSGERGVSGSRSVSPDTVTVQTTMGDLIEAITEVAIQAGRTEEEGYRLASFTIQKLLRDKRRRELLGA